MNNDFYCLIGKKLICDSILSKDKECITIKTENSIINLIATGSGYYSESWVENFEGLTKVCVIEKVIGKNVVELDHYKGEDKYFDEIKQYFYEIVTDKGQFTIEMRNTSNGDYYGGFFTFKEEKVS